MKTFFWQLSITILILCNSCISTRPPIDEHQINSIVRDSLTYYINRNSNIIKGQLDNPQYYLTYKNKAYGTEIIFEIKQNAYQSYDIGGNTVNIMIGDTDSGFINKRNERKYLLDNNGNLKFIQAYLLGKAEIQNLVFSNISIQDSLLSFIAASDSIPSASGSQTTICISLDSDKRLIGFTAGNFAFTTKEGELIDPNCMQHDWLATRYKNSDIMIKMTGASAQNYIHLNKLRKSLADSIIIESNKPIPPEKWNDNIPWEAFAVRTERRYRILEDGSLILERAYHMGKDLLE